MKIELNDIEVVMGDDSSIKSYGAELAIDGHRIGKIIRSAVDKELVFNPIDSHARALLDSAESYFRQAPRPIMLAQTSPLAFNFKQNLEGHIDKAIVEHSMELGMLQAKKEMLSGIVFGNPDSVRVIRQNKTVEEIINMPAGAFMLRKYLENEVLPNLGPNDKILNANFPDEVMKGLIVKPAERKRPGNKIKDDNLSHKGSKGKAR